MKQQKRYAYCTFLIENDRYLPGVLTFAYALKKQEISADFICIVTDEVPVECSRLISCLYTYVFCVEQSRVKNINKGKRSDREKLFTRFLALEALKRNRLRYDKIILCDSDLLPLRNFSDLCFYPAPSGILNERKENVIGYGLQNEWVWFDVYRDIPPKASIPKRITDRVKTDVMNLGVNSVIYVLDDDTISYSEIAQDLENEQMRAQIAAYPWPDMQYMTCKLSGRWHNLDIRYASFNSFPDLHSIYGTHYAGMKPWDVGQKSYLHYCRHEDYKLWICVFLNMMQEKHSFLRYSRLKKLRDFLMELVRTDRSYVLDVKKYPELHHLLRK